MPTVIRATKAIGPSAPGNSTRGLTTKSAKAPPIAPPTAPVRRIRQSEAICLCHHLMMEIAASGRSR
jgi:hypothetical protein